MAKKDIKPVTLKIRPVETKTEIDERGAFQRQPNRFTTPFGDGTGQLKAEKGKYRLFWARGCHWSNRASTVPTLVDLDTYTVANNDYHRLTNYFETAFKPFHKEGAPNLYPEELREDIDNLNDNVLFPFINNGVYRMMFAQSIVAYEEAFDDFFTTLDVLENRLATNRFLFGDYVTDSDVRFFVTLARFDTHYYRNLGPIKKRISEYENIWGYARDLYEIPAFRNNTYFHDIARGWDTKKEKLFVDFNSRFADDIDFDAIWSTPQKRKYLSKTPDQKFLVD